MKCPTCDNEMVYVHGVIIAGVPPTHVHEYTCGKCGSDVRTELSECVYDELADQSVVSKMLKARIKPVTASSYWVSTPK